MKKDNKPVVGTLRAMNIGDCAVFDSSRICYIRNAICNNLEAERAQGYRWRTEKNSSQHTLTVTRIS